MGILRRHSLSTKQTPKTPGRSFESMIPGICRGRSRQYNKGVERIAQNNITTLHVDMGYRYSSGSSSGIDQRLYPGRHRRRHTERLSATDKRTDECRPKRQVGPYRALST